MKVGRSILSLEILFQVYVHQIRNEFSVLNPNAPQGYIYTIDPPWIFAKEIGRSEGGVLILNRLQALAFRAVSSKGLFSNLKQLGFNDYDDKSMIELFKQILPNVTISSKSALFDAAGNYKGPQGLALVVHNNSDGFGQNIEWEGPSSMDGVIGTYSDQMKFALYHFCGLHGSPSDDCGGMPFCTRRTVCVHRAARSVWCAGVWISLTQNWANPRQSAQRSDCCVVTD